MSRLAGSFADRLRSTLFRRGRTPGLRTAKVTLAVVAAYLLAEVLHLSEHPIVAPLVASTPCMPCFCTMADVVSLIAA